MKDKVSTAIVVATIEKQSKPLFKKIDSFIIKDNTDHQALVSYMKNLKAIKSIAKDKRKSIEDPLKEALKQVDELFKPFFAKVDETEIEVKNEILRFEEKKEQLNKKLNSDFEKGNIKKVATYAAKQAELNAKVNGSSIRELEVLEIVNQKLIPREWLVPDEKLILKALKEGKKIAGCMLITKKTVAI